MKTHINQILTVVSFFSLSLTTTLAISWGMNGFKVDEIIAEAECLGQDNAVIKVIKSSNRLNLKYNDTLKSFIPKISLKAKG